MKKSLFWFVRVCVCVWMGGWMGGWIDDRWIDRWVDG